MPLQSARKPTAQVMSYIGREVDWTDFGIGAALPFGSLPGGATPNSVSVLIDPGWTWTAGTYFAIYVGTKAKSNRWFDGQYRAGIDVGRVDRAVNADQARPLDQDTECFVSVVPQWGVTAKPRSGHAICWLSYLPQALLRDHSAPWD